MTHLRFCCTYGLMSTDKENTGLMRRIAIMHPQKSMRELGITYQHATPQSLGSQWWFWNCENIPSALPLFLTEMTLDPMKMIGRGLNEDLAISIRDHA